jgi:phosphatidylserine/phosphatidylglycerophosphate/cardiolipin synthase-like enzyme
MSSPFEVVGQNAAAPFTLKVYRGEGMVLLAMNWRHGQPPEDFVGFAIEYREPQAQQYYALKNRLSFLGPEGQVEDKILSTRLSPIQYFRWVHFPYRPEKAGMFTYRVTAVYMNEQDELRYGDVQEVAIELGTETYHGQLNVAFTRGFVSSQAFVDYYAAKGPIADLLPATASEGLTYVPTHPLANDALAWMGFEARRAILDVLEEAIADGQAQVRVVAYDLNEPEVVGRLARLGDRLRIIIDDSADHGAAGSAEDAAAARLALTAGAGNVKRQHMRKLQHNKTIVVNSPTLKRVVCGSTNFSWRGFYVQSNNAVLLQGATAVTLFGAAFDNYWEQTPTQFGGTASASWADLGLAGIDAQVAFSPHAKANALLLSIGDDISAHTTSTLLFSLAFLYQTPGSVSDAIKAVLARDGVFVYGISDRKVGGLKLQKPDGNDPPVYPEALADAVPSPFKEEPTGGGGIRMHHKFVVIDFDRPTARVYLGSYNFSPTADVDNGENLLLVRDRRVAVSYMVEALRICDHYAYRDKLRTVKGTLMLRHPPRKPDEQPWWRDHFVVPSRVRDRETFA